MSEQQAEQIQGEAGSAGAGEAAPKVSLSGKPFGTTALAAAEIESPQIAPDQEETTPKPDVPKIEAVKVEPAKAEAAKIEAVNTETAKIETTQAEPPRIGALKAEVPKFEAPKAEAPKSGALKAEAPKIELAKSELAKSELAKSEVAKSEVVKSEAAKAAAPKVEASRATTGRAETAKVDNLKVGAVKPEVRRFPAKPTTPTIMSPPGGRSWRRKGSDDDVDAEAEPGPVSPAPGNRPFVAMAMALAVAMVAGALGGALATAGLTHFAGEGSSTATGSGADPALTASVARIDADILALKAGLEETSKTGASQFNQTGERLVKIEQALAEPATKLAKFSEAVDNLNTAPPAAANAMAAAAPKEPKQPKQQKEPKDVTGSVTRQVVASAAPVPPAPVAPPKPEVGRLPTLEGWVLRDVRRGGALIEGRAGLYEVYAGDPIPGLGKVDAIRRQDGRWVVVTTKGLVVER